MSGTDGQHLVRMASLFAVGVVVFLVLRHLLVPAGFGVHGHYRAGALDDNRARPMQFAGRARCEACHDEVVAARVGSRHARIGCEACHGPALRHAEAVELGATATAKPPRPDPRAVCIRCHSASASRPTSFPQVKVAEHSPAGPCTECHQAHAPKIS